jgi:spermidine synthase
MGRAERAEGRGRGTTGGDTHGGHGEQSDSDGDAAAHHPDAVAVATSKDTRTAKGAKGARTLRPVMTIEAGRKVMRVGGVIQSVHVDEGYEPDVWDAMLPRERPERVLILGLGGGTMAHLLTARFGPMPIVGVERDPAVIYLARHEFGLDRLPHLRIVAEDAFAFVRAAVRASERFDTICVDLYTAGRMAHGVLDPVFLRDLTRILAPGGGITFNLWRSSYLGDQLRRIERVLRIGERIDVDDNLVVRCAHRDPVGAPHGRATNAPALK